MRNTITAVGLAACVILSDAALAAAWFVDGAVSASGDGTSWQTAFQKVQEGIDAAGNGDRVIVAPGTYVERINFNGTNIVLRSRDPWDAGIVASTIIDGNEGGPAVTFSGEETGDCVLSGFTIRKGYNAGWPAGGGGVCGGTRTSHTQATIENNVLTDNDASEGGGIAFCDGAILNNTITANRAVLGAGLSGCDGAIVNNVISHNSATIGGGLSGCGGLIANNVISENFGHGGGGGLAGCGGIIQNNLITKNWTEQDESGGGGLESCDGTIRNNVISHNRTRCHGAGGLNRCNGRIENNLIVGNTSDGSGGGLSNCSGAIVNNTIAFNRGWSGGLSDCTGTIRNCIVWGNDPGNFPQLSQSSQPTYSCIQNWVGGGEGNISLNPYFVDPENGDYHLKSWSPCIDAGDPSSDFWDEPQPNGLRIDMGAYGNTPEATCKSADTDSDELPDDWEMEWFGNLGFDAASDPDGDRIVNLTDYRYGWSPKESSATLVENRAKEEYYETIQDAITDSDATEVIVVHPGVYRENIHFAGRNVALRSTNPSDPAVIASTVLDGNGLGSVVTFSGSENEWCILAGFTIRNGNGLYGGAVCGGTSDIATHAAIRNCIITGNSADQGGGIAFCDGLIENNLIYGNSAGYGGGIAYCGGVIRNCTIANNSSSWGGGLHDCDATIVNCIIWGNIADQDPQIFHSTEPVYSCVEGWTGGDEGNIAENPLFVDAANGNFRLSPASPCIDAGSNEPGLPETDLAGAPRILFGGKSLTVDMGAYEHRVVSIARDASGIVLTWGSTPGRTYQVRFSDDLIEWQLADSVVATGDTCSWTDHDGSGIPVPVSSVSQRLYRIIENP